MRISSKYKIILMHVVSNWFFHGSLMGKLAKYTAFAQYLPHICLAWGAIILDFVVSKYILRGNDYRYGLFDIIEDLTFISGIIVILFMYSLPDSPKDLQTIRFIVVFSECAIATERLLLTKKKRDNSYSSRSKTQ